MRLRNVILNAVCVLALGSPASLSAAAPEATAAPKPAGTPAVDSGKPRLVMVKVPHWKVRFFGLPEDLPVLIEAGETFSPTRRVYDFGAGLQAMDVFLTLRPKDPNAPAYRTFREKWPLYQEFFKAVDAENFETARGLLKRIYGLDPKEPAVHFYLGSMSTQFGDYAQAEKEYRTCLELYPGYGPAYINLARLQRARQAKDEAAATLQKALVNMDDSEQAGTRNVAEQMLKALGQK
jgi:tetratricopeptide (TPR) repeat protein